MRSECPVSLPPSAPASVELTSPGTTSASRTKAVEHGFDAFQRACRLSSVGSRADVELELRCADFELVDEDSGHLTVIVLAGVDDHMAELGRTPPELRDERRHLHVVRSRADQIRDCPRVAQSRDPQVRRPTSETA